MQRSLLIVLVFLIVCGETIYLTSKGIGHVLADNQAALTIQADQTGAHISPTLYGLMFEDISHSGDGGLYGELINKRTFKKSSKLPTSWSLVTSSGAQGTMTLDNDHPIDKTTLTTSLKLQVTQVSKDQRVGAANTGYWGIPVQPTTTYQASFYAMASPDFTGPLTVDIESNSGDKIYAQTTINSLSTSWQRYTVKLTTGQAAPSKENQFVLSTNSIGTVWFNLISLFPPTWNNRSNGLRSDLMQKLHDMHPSFLRFPGGNYLEGNSFKDRFDWKKTVGDLSQRLGHYNSAWNYLSTDGLGLLEYLEWCEDLQMTPVLAVYAGYSLDHSHVPVGTPQFDSLIQDALDEVEYATGDTTTRWGSQRAADGHPAPFTIPYVEIGNEDTFDGSGSYNDRFAAFYEAFKSKYPDIKLIATTQVKSRTPDLYDEHYYRDPADFEKDTAHYDNYSRNGPKIFVGEYASLKGGFGVHGPNLTPDLDDALGDAAWMTGLERNSDVVVMASYAPLMVNLNAPSWPTNLIGYDALNSYGSPSYYVQMFFSLYHGDVVVPTQLSGGDGKLYFVTSKASSNGTMYLKVVNISSEAANAQIKINGVKTIDQQGTAIILTSGSVNDTNSLTNPTKVAPVAHPLNNLSSSFPYSFDPHSVTVLQFTVH